MSDDPTDLDALADEVRQAVARLLREGKVGRVEVNVNPRVRRIDIQVVVRERAA